MSATTNNAAADAPQANEQGQAPPGEATLLVSEFPPPPFYYRAAASAEGLAPPEIPVEALQRGTARAAAAAARARAESEKLRLGQDDNGQANAASVLGGGGGAQPMDTDDQEEGDVVAVFGEIVEDPEAVQPLDACEDPRVVRDEVQRLNTEVLRGFVKLVHDLVNNPTNNKKTRDELSHNTFLMLQECNKFREHQAREHLIALLEQQLKGRKTLLLELEGIVSEADNLLGDTKDMSSSTNGKQ